MMHSISVVRGRLCRSLKRPEGEEVTVSHFCELLLSFFRFHVWKELSQQVRLEVFR